MSGEVVPLSGKDAEIQRLSRKVGRMRLFQIAVGSERDEALRKLAAVAALADDTKRPDGPFTYALLREQLRAILGGAS